MRLINLSSFETIQKNVTTSGTPVILSPRQTATTIAFVNNAALGTNDTITDSAAQFLVSGFRAGDVVNITGSTSNNIQVKIESVVAGTITLTKSGILTTEIAGDSVTLDLLHGREVEDGVGVVVKAKAANTGTITVGATSARALNTNTNYDSNVRLSSGQAITLQVRNLNAIWIDATVNAEGVEVLFES